MILQKPSSPIIVSCGIRLQKSSLSFGPHDVQMTSENNLFGCIGISASRYYLFDHFKAKKYYLCTEHTPKEISEKNLKPIH